MFISSIISYLIHEGLFIQHRDTQLLRLCQLAARFFPADKVSGLSADGG